MSSRSVSAAMNARTLFGLHKNSLAYAMTSLPAAMMNSVFRFYYVNVFLNRYHIQESWFQVTQVLFLIWNAINDPLFGYFQDKNRTRQQAIKGGAFLFVLSFLIFWFPWTSDGLHSPTIVGMHLLVSLFFYDALFTYVLLAQCAIFAEISKVHTDKVRLIKYSQIASLIGSVSVLICNLVSSNLANYTLFQCATIVIAVLSYFFLRYSGNSILIEADVASESPIELEGDRYSYFSLTLQIMKDRNFLSFVIVNLLTIFGATFTSNFTAIICNHLITEAEMSSATKSMFYGSMFLLPQIVVILGAPVVSRIGYYRIVRCSFLIKIVMSCLMYFLGPQHKWLLILFIVLDGTNSDAVFSLYNLPLSDIIEDDLVRNKRSSPVSSMVFGTNALITKPAQSLAPMFAVWVLNMYGYANLQQGQKLSPEPLDSLFTAMFNMVCLIPICVGILQYLTWSFFRLRDTHTVSTKYLEV